MIHLLFPYHRRPISVFPTQGEKRKHTIWRKSYEPRRGFCLRPKSAQTEIIIQTMNSCKDHPEKNPPWLHASNRPKLADYYQIHRDIARKRNLRLIDHYPAWLDVMNNDPARFDKLVPDRIHPNAEGAREIIMPTLIKELGL